MADNLKFTREGGEATGPAPRNRMAARAVAAVISALFALAALSTAAGVEPKRIVLSFDDAPRGDGRVFAGAARATALIEGLRAAEVEEVVFFVTTRGFEAQPDGKARVERYAAAGHLIANHSHTHPWAHQTGVADYLADVDEAQARLEGIENLRPWFRFPFLDEGRDPAKVAAIAEGLEARGLANGYVTVDTYDWHMERRLQDALRDGRAVDYDKLGRLYVDMSLYAAEFYDGIAVQTLGYSPVHVLLLHENDLAALYATDLVKAFRDAGWEIVGPDAAYGEALPTPETVRTSQGRVFALAADAGRSRRTMWTWAIDEEMLDLMLERRGAIEPPAAADGR